MRWLRLPAKSRLNSMVLRSLLPLIEGTIIGLTFGLIDVYSKERDWFNASFAYLVAGVSLGLIHRRRAWQAWPLLGWCFYFMHRGAIAYGYRPPYVEKNAEAAIQSLGVLFPAAIGLAIGTAVRFAVAMHHLAAKRLNTSAHDAAIHADRGQYQRQPNPTTADSQQLRATSGKVLRDRWTVSNLMFTIAWIGIYLATVRALLSSDDSLGFTTVYSERFSERAFNSSECRTVKSSRLSEHRFAKYPWALRTKRSGTTAINPTRSLTSGVAGLS